MYYQNSPKFGQKCHNVARTDHASSFLLHEIIPSTIFLRIEYFRTNDHTWYALAIDGC